MKLEPAILKAVLEIIVLQECSARLGTAARSNGSPHARV